MNGDATGPVAKNVRRIAPMDIPGGGQIVAAGGYAYIGHMAPPHGTSILDVSDPQHPRVIASIALHDDRPHSHKVRVTGDLMITNSERWHRSGAGRATAIPDATALLETRLGRAPDDRELAREIGVEVGDVPALRDYLERGGYRDGGFDFYARLIGGYMEKHLPGLQIVVKNAPGAGHIIGTNKTYIARPDGLTMGTFVTGMVYSQLLGRKGVRFDLARMTFLGKASGDPRVLVVSTKSPYRSLDDLRGAEKPVMMASGGPGSAAYAETKMVEYAFGLKFHLLPGYRGRDAEMAMMRGEVAGNVGSLSSFAPFVENGHGRIVLAIWDEPLADYPGVPLAAKIATTDTARSLMALMLTQAKAWRLTALPPGVPKDRLKALRTAYRKALEDPGLLALAKKARRPIIPLYGADVDAVIRSALSQPPEVVKLLAKIMNVEVPLVTVKVKILETKRGGRLLFFKDKGGKKVKTRISGSRTKVKIAGKDDRRKNIKPGMICEVTYPGPGQEAKKVSCD